MFANQRSGGTRSPVKRPDPSRDTAVTILTSGCHFTGKLYCGGSSRIGGKIEGEIISEGLLIIEEGARINAHIRADEAIVQGQVEGRLEARIRVELCSTSNFLGDISAPILVIKEGAQFNGRSSMQAAEVLNGVQNHASAHEPHPEVLQNGFASAKGESPDLGLDSSPEVRAN